VAPTIPFADLVAASYTVENTPSFFRKTFLLSVVTPPSTKVTMLRKASKTVDTCVFVPFGKEEIGPPRVLLEQKKLQEEGGGTTNHPHYPKWGGSDPPPSLAPEFREDPILDPNNFLQCFPPIAVKSTWYGLPWAKTAFKRPAAIPKGFWKQNCWLNFIRVEFEEILSFLDDAIPSPLFSLMTAKGKFWFYLQLSHI